MSNKQLLPQEKAQELYFKYRKIVAGDAAIKQCTLIAVDEIIKIIDTYKEEQYWIEVKTEIEKL